MIIIVPTLSYHSTTQRVFIHATKIFTSVSIKNYIKNQELKQRINKLPVIAHHHLCTVTTGTTDCISAGLGIDIRVNQEIVKV